MQPDTNYLAAYGLQHADKAFFRLKYLQANAADYKSQSLVIGVLNNGNAKAYDWDLINYKRLIEDSFSGVPVLLTLEPDNTSFHVWNRNVKGVILNFIRVGDTGEMKDVNTQSTWNKQGTCINGKLQGTQLKELQSYLETRKSWNTFHPGATTYKDGSTIPR